MRRFSCRLTYAGHRTVLMTETVLPAAAVNNLLPINGKQRRYWNAPQGSALALLLSDVGLGFGQD